MKRKEVGILRKRIKWRGFEKLRRELEGHILLIYQYLVIYVSFNTQIQNLFFKVFFRVTGHLNSLGLIGLSVWKSWQTPQSSANWDG